MHISPCLILSFFTKSKEDLARDKKVQVQNTKKYRKAQVFLYIFISLIAITSGLMYSVINPAFSHHKVLSSLYWAIPYILAIYILIRSKNKVNKAYTLYLAILLIGLSFLLFIILDRSWLSYILVNTLMMSGFGVCDLFWWSIIGELLDYVKNPAKIFGRSLSANLLGIFIGSAIGTKFISIYEGINSSLLALTLVFVILIILPFLNKSLSLIIKDHIFLFNLYSKEEKNLWP